MSTDTHVTAIPEGENAPRPIGPAQIVSIVLLAAAGVVAARYFNSALPALIAAVVAGLTPKQHGWRVRAPIGVMAGVLALFVVRLWPSTDVADITVPPSEVG